MDLVPSPPGRLGCRATASILCGAAIATLLMIARWHPALAERLLAEGGIVEWLQVLLLGAAGVLAARQGWSARRAGRPVVLEVAIVTSMVMVCIGEVDLDRAIFGEKVISTYFLLYSDHPLALRALAALIVIGIPAAVGVWLLVRWRALWAAGLEGLRQPWGQTAVCGAALFVLIEILERPINHIPWQPRYFVEETLELVAAVCILAGLVARRRGSQG